MDPVVTTFEEAYGHFADRSPSARREWDRWAATASDLKREWLCGSRTRVAYEVTPETLEGVFVATAHPLGNLDKGQVERYSRDWNPDFAFQHVFNHATETLGIPPTWQAFRRFCVEDDLARVMLVQPAATQVELTMRQFEIPRELAVASLTWRIGIAFYSFLRELYCIAVLRAADVDARTHPLPDVLWRVDLWVDDVCLELFIENPRFKEGAGGRKTAAERWLGNGPFRFARIALTKQHRFGRVHLPDSSGLVASVQKAVQG